MVGDNDEKLVCQSFHLTGIDGNPLVSASIHIRYVERRREGINIATDIITDKKGVAEVALPVNGTGSFIISHGHYHCRGLINLDETDVSTKISFKGFKLVTASITCPDIPKNVKVNFRVSPQVVASAGQLSHLLTYTSPLVKNKIGIWKTRIYVPKGASYWCFGGDSVYAIADTFEVRENVEVKVILPSFTRITLGMKNAPRRIKYNIQLNQNGLKIGSYAPGSKVYLPDGDYTCTIDSMYKETSFQKFDVKGEPKTVYFDYAVHSECAPVRVTGKAPDMKMWIPLLDFIPLNAGGSWDNRYRLRMRASGMLPVGTYEYRSVDSHYQVRGVFTVEKDKENLLVCDASKLQQIIFEKENKEDAGGQVELIDETMSLVAYTAGVSGSFWASPGTYILRGLKTKTVKVVLGKDAPAKVVLEPCNVIGKTALCTIKPPCGIALRDAVVEIDGEPFVYLGPESYALHTFPGEHTCVVRRTGFKTFIGKVLLPESAGAYKIEMALMPDSRLK